MSLWPPGVSLHRSEELVLGEGYLGHAVKGSRCSIDVKKHVPEVFVSSPSRTSFLTPRGPKNVTVFWSQKRDRFRFSYHFSLGLGFKT